MLCELSGQELTLLAAVIANQIACCVPEEQLSLLGAFYTVLGDQLALIASAGCDSSSNDHKPNSNHSK